MRVYICDRCGKQTSLQLLEEDPFSDDIEDRYAYEISRMVRNRKHGDYAVPVPLHFCKECGTYIDELLAKEIDDARPIIVPVVTKEQKDS